MMTLIEMRERAARLAKQAAEKLSEYEEGQVPTEVAEEIKTIHAEVVDLRGKMQAREDEDTLRQQMTAHRDHFWKPQDQGGQLAPHQPASEFDNVVDFAKAVWACRDGKMPPDPRLKQLVEGTGASGGFLVPAEFEAQLLTVAAENAIVRPRATVIPMARRQVDIPALDYDAIASPDGQTNFYGGIILEWTEEAAAKPEVDINFRMKQLVVHDLTGYLPVSDSLLEDSAISLPPLLARMFGGAIGWYEDYSFLQGSGVGQPTGVINAPATIVVARAGAGAVSYTDLVNMDAQLLPGARPVWVMAISVKPQLRLMQDPAGNYIWPSFGGAAAAAMGDMVLGYPIIWTEKLPGLGNPGDVMLADFSYYLLGQRKGVTISSSEHYLFRYNQTAFKVVERVDGNPWLNLPIETQEGTTVSPFLILGDTS